MGAVYRARDTKPSRDVAIKVLPPDVVDSTEALMALLAVALALAGAHANPSSLIPDP